MVCSRFTIYLEVIKIIQKNEVLNYSVRRSFNTLKGTNNNCTYTRAKVLTNLTLQSLAKPQTLVEPVHVKIANLKWNTNKSPVQTTTTA